MSQSDPPGRSVVATPPPDVLHDVLNDALPSTNDHVLDARTTDGSLR
jgi:hypothetical protein